MFVRVLVVIAMLVSSAHADSWMTPTERRLTSPNKKWEAVITPAKDGKTGAHTSIGSKGKPGTPFTTETRWMPVDSLLFDDGSLLVLDGWHRLGHGTVAALHDRDGSVRWSKTLEELVGKDVIATVTASVSSIWWRKTPLEWTLAKDGKHVLVTLIDENQVSIALANGSTKIVAIANLGDDPDRLLNRARTLARTDGKAKEAQALLDRALAKNPELFEGILLYVDLLQRANDHARVNDLVEKLASRWKTKDGYNITNVYVVWAKSLVVLARPKDAERVLRLGVTAAPGYTNPAIALAELLEGQTRTKDADAVLDAFVTRLFEESSLDTYALGDIAEHYEQRKEPAKALALYLKGYKKDEVTNQFLYASLAKLYEDTGNKAEAIRVNEQLLAYFTKMGSAFDAYKRETEEALARLRKKKP
jgi:tetratricopeptide (TPR) repeat protein